MKPIPNLGGIRYPSFPKFHGNGLLVHPEPVQGSGYTPSAIRLGLFPSLHTTNAAEMEYVVHPPIYRVHTKSVLVVFEESNAHGCHFWFKSKAR
jgi:hypothetical protein